MLTLEVAVVVVKPKVLPLPKPPEPAFWLAQVAKLLPLLLSATPQPSQKQPGEMASPTPAR